MRSTLLKGWTCLCLFFHSNSSLERIGAKTNIRGGLGETWEGGGERKIQKVNPDMGLSSVLGLRDLIQVHENTTVHI
jgi:hypothetical protein